jgi:hypothetical protein
MMTDVVTVFEDPVRYADQPGRIDRATAAKVGSGGGAGSGTGPAEQGQETGGTEGYRPVGKGTRCLRHRGRRGQLAPRDRRQQLVILGGQVVALTALLVTRALLKWRMTSGGRDT